MTAIIALVVALLALALSVISLLATGTLALRGRADRPRLPRLAAGELSELDLPTSGRDIAEVLGPIIDYVIPTEDGEAGIRDMFLVDDGPILLVSTGCATCRHLISEGQDVLAAEGVRALVAAPSVERGREFMEKDCGTDRVKYQVDVLGERSRALGVLDFPATVLIRDGLISKAYITVTKEHIGEVLHMAGERNPAAPSEESEQATLE